MDHEGGDKYIQGTGEILKSNGAQAMSVQPCIWSLPGVDPMKTL